jgi:hypothetical protein
LNYVDEVEKTHEDFEFVEFVFTEVGKTGPLAQVGVPLLNGVHVFSE